MLLWPTVTFTLFQNALNKTIVHLSNVTSRRKDILLCPSFNICTNIYSDCAYFTFYTCESLNKIARGVILYEVPQSTNTRTEVGWTWRPHPSVRQFEITRLRGRKFRISGTVLALCGRVPSYWETQTCLKRNLDRKECCVKRKIFTVLGNFNLYSSTCI